MNRVKKYLHRFILFTALLVPWGASASAEIVVIVAADSPIEQLSKGQLINIFLGRSNYFDNGLRAIPIDQNADSQAREQFYQSLLTWSPAKLKAHWSKVIFTGRGKPPIQVGDDEDVKAAVRSNHSAIGYIDRANANEHVRILDVSL